MIEVLKAGFHTSIQDLGRSGYRKYGVPISGAMDKQSALISNRILGNSPGAAVIEITLNGPELYFATATRVAITGANLSPLLNNIPLVMYKSIAINKGDIISFGDRKAGVRSYLAIAGGVQSDIVMNSRSYYSGITQSAVIKRSDKLSFHSSFKVGASTLFSRNESSFTTDHSNIEAYQGPEFDLLDEGQKKCLSNTNFTIGSNNRMGYQLQEPLINTLPSILSSAVLPGTVQLTPSGKLIVLMRDCQTTGGYPRVLQLTETSINVLSQKMQHEPITFRFL